MVADMEMRREDTREAAVEAVRRLEQTWVLFKELEPKMIVGDEQIFRELKDRFGSPYGFGIYFRGGMGAEAVRDLLRDLDLDEESLSLREIIKTSKGQKQQRAIKRLKVVEAFIKSGNKPEWMILEAVPVIPPELRPMVQLDGGRFATSDLNDLYRRVINRNNRLKRLLDLGAPEIIVNNEKRMLQEAVDALFDNGRRGRAVTGPGNRPLKSLSDMLKGKQGRFRQNLLGKRVDYSGRSVIVAGPNLKLHQCGLPKLMALELFKPFIMSRLVERKAVQNIKAAKKMVESMIPEVWDVLEEVIAEHPVLLNRAPTLHRLGIQAFEPVLVEGKAIQVHPLVCQAFNADFDGDQMAVHLPLSAEAQAEARVLMLSSNNILSPASGRPLATPSQDMVLGAYFLTYCEHDLEKLTAEQAAKAVSVKGLRRFRTEEDVEFAIDAGSVDFQDPIEYTWSGERLVTTPGRVIFNAEVERALDEATGGDFEDHPFLNKTLTKRELDTFIGELVEHYGPNTIAGVARRHQVGDVPLRDARRDHDLEERHRASRPTRRRSSPGSRTRSARSGKEYDRGLMTEEERDERIIAIWTQATDQVADRMMDNLEPTNPIYMMANSGARGSFNQIRQLAGMRGLMADPKGADHRPPDQGQLHGGADRPRVLHLDARRPQGPRGHGAAHRRLGLPHAAARRRVAGRDHPRAAGKVRRLRDGGAHRAARSSSTTCRTRASPGASRPRTSTSRSRTGSPARPSSSRRAPRSRRRRSATLVEEFGEYAETATIPVRSVLKCRSEWGICRLCYGTFLATGGMTEIGDAVGHHRRAVDRRAGHAAHHADVPHGRCRRSRHHARPAARRRDLRGAEPEGRRDARPTSPGKVDIEDAERTIKVTVTPTALDASGELPDPKEYSFPRRTRLLVTKGQMVEAGDPLNEGSLNPAELLMLKGDTQTELYLVGRGAEGLQVAGRRDPRQAHRADRPPDAEEGPRRDERRHRRSSRASSSTRSSSSARTLA